MAISYTNDGASNVGASSLLTTPERYTSLNDLLDPTKPDNRDLLVSTYGDQGITGFLTLTGAVNNAGTSDEVQWWEEGRLHPYVTGSISTATLTMSGTADDSIDLRLNDVLLTDENERLVVTAITDGDADGFDNSYTVARLDGAGNPTGTYGAGSQFAVIGNIFAQGTDQPGRFRQPGLQKRVNPYIITKETYKVNGSQATNIGWVNVGGGEYRWYVKGEQDARKRFMNQREMMLLYGQKAATDGTELSVPVNDTTSTAKVAGSEGYFAAVEDRGLVASVSGGAQGTFADMSDIDGIILELDKEGAPAEYAMYLNRAASLDIDDMLAQGIATQVTAGLPGQFGAFNNDADMAVRLGFKSFTRGGYTFHKHDWKLLNDPMLGAVGTIKGAMVPLANVVDAKTGNSAPALEMNYKAASGYNRDVEHWVRGSILGFNNMSEDVAEFYYRSECNLVTRAANQHVLIK
jgi:hypothetical protein